MKDISILFSGGPDSTLAALHALDECDRIHLLTYHHSLMSLMGKHNTVTQELQQKFGEDRVIAHEEEIGDLYKKTYWTQWSRRFPKYRTFYVPWMCGGCKLAMHWKTIQYNLKNEIGKTYDGASTESAPLFPAQTREYIDVMKTLYARYGMEYDAPIWAEGSTDEQCVQRGITSLKNTKKEHVVFSTQHSCMVGLAIHAHARFYYHPFHGRKRMSAIAGPFLREMIDLCCPPGSEGV